MTDRLNALAVSSYTVYHGCSRFLGRGEGGELSKVVSANLTLNQNNLPRMNNVS